MRARGYSHSVRSVSHGGQANHTIVHTHTSLKILRILSFLKVKYHGFKALTAGLQADTYLEAFHIEKQKVGYSDMSMDRATEALVSMPEKEILDDLLIFLVS